MSRTIFQPTCVAEAIDLLAGSPSPFDGPTQHRYRTLEHLEHAFDSPQVRPWADALQTSGWQLLVERYHYEFVPGSDLAADVRAVLRGTLDAHDQALVARVGLEAATRESLDYLLDVAPWQCLRLAFADGPEPVGHVSWRSPPPDCSRTGPPPWSPTPTAPTSRWPGPPRRSAGRTPSNASTSSRSADLDAHAGGALIEAPPPRRRRAAAPPAAR